MPSIASNPAGSRIGFVGAACSLVAVFAASASPIPLYELYRRSDGLSHADLSLTAVAYFVAVMAALVVLGRLSNHVGRRPVALAALVVTAAWHARTDRGPQRRAAHRRPGAPGHRLRTGLQRAGRVPRRQRAVLAELADQLRHDRVADGRPHARRAGLRRARRVRSGAPHAGLPRRGGRSPRLRGSDRRRPRDGRPRAGRHCRATAAGPRSSGRTEPAAGHKRDLRGHLGARRLLPGVRAVRRRRPARHDEHAHRRDHLRFAHGAERHRGPTGRPDHPGQRSADRHRRVLRRRRSDPDRPPRRISRPITPSRAPSRAPPRTRHSPGACTRCSPMPRPPSAPASCRRSGRWERLADTDRAGARQFFGQGHG